MSVHVKLIRHSKSIANEYHKKYGKTATGEEYINAPLSEEGYSSIDKNRRMIQYHITNSDILLSSPLTRTLETCLHSLKGIQSRNVYLAPVISELGLHVENMGRSRSEIKNDNKLINMNMNDNVIFPSEHQYYANFTYFYGYPENTKWYMNTKHYTDQPERKKQILNFLSSEIFKDKTVMIFTHFVIISILLNIHAKNLDIIEFDYDQDKQIISNITINHSEQLTK